MKGELLVKFAPKPDGKPRTIAERNQILASIDGGTIKHSYRHVPGLTRIKLSQNDTVEKALVRFKDADGILYAVPNRRIIYASTFPNDPCFPKLWGMHNIGQGGGTRDADTDAPQAWDIATGSGDIIVAVLDSGVDYNHPDLTA